MGCGDCMGGWRSSKNDSPCGSKNNTPCGSPFCPCCAWCPWGGSQNNPPSSTQNNSPSCSLIASFEPRHIVSSMTLSVYGLLFSVQGVALLRTRQIPDHCCTDSFTIFAQIGSCIAHSSWRAPYHRRGHQPT